MVALLYALGIFEIGLAPVFFIGAIGAGRDAEFVSGVFAVLAVGSLPLGFLTIGAGWILDRVLHVKKTVEQLLRATQSAQGHHASLPSP
jgi:hypothetical protein